MDNDFKDTLWDNNEFTFDDDYDGDSKVPYEIPKEVRKITTVTVYFSILFTKK